MMWQFKLEEINEKKRSFNQIINNGVSEKQLINFRSKVRDIYNLELTDEYVNFLKTENGFEFNGYVIYGVGDDNNESIYVTDFISTNEIWNEDDNSLRYVFFGDSNISWYCYDTIKNEYVELDKPSGSLIRNFDNFEAMLVAILTDCLL